MKKTLLAAALFAGFAGFAGAAQAETQVTLYGILDTGIEVNNVKANNGVSYTTAGLASGVQSGDRWGMKGTEDLGGGTQAVFTLESGFSLANGTSAQGSRLFGRRAFLGLQNPSWGMVRVGRGPTISTDMMQNADSDPFGYGFGPMNLGAIATSIDTYRTDNSISYMSPVFAGFQVGAGYSFNVDKGNNYSVGTPMGTNREPGLDGAITYTNGPLFAGVTYSQTNVFGKGTIRQLVADASYNFQVLTVYGAYVRGWNGLVGGTAGGTADFNNLGSTISLNGNTYASGAKQNAFMLGLSVPVGTATSLFATYQHQTLGGAGSNGILSSSAARSAQNTFGVGAQYNLSKRTNVYAMVGYVDGYQNVYGQKDTAGVVGLRHKF